MDYLSSFLVVVGVIVGLFILYQLYIIYTKKSNPPNPSKYARILFYDEKGLNEHYDRNYRIPANSNIFVQLSIPFVKVEFNTIKDADDGPSILSIFQSVVSQIHDDSHVKLIIVGNTPKEALRNLFLGILDDLEIRKITSQNIDQVKESYIDEIRRANIKNALERLRDSNQGDTQFCLFKGIKMKINELNNNYQLTLEDDETMLTADLKSKHITDINYFDNKYKSKEREIRVHIFGLVEPSNDKLFEITPYFIYQPIK
jgi:hypothetical protein